MSFSYRRTYRGPIEAVLLDWAGTTMDFGCMAPAVVFVEVFERRKVPITIDEARAPMGAHKKVHIQRISELDSVHRRWQEVHGRPPGEADVDAMFAEFVPLQLACLSETRSARATSPIPPCAPRMCRQGGPTRTCACRTPSTSKSPLCNPA